MSNEENKNVLENGAENVSDASTETEEENSNSIEKDENENTEVKEEAEAVEVNDSEDKDTAGEKTAKEKSYMSRVPFFQNIEALIIDQFICVILAIGLLYLSKLILKALGYYILDTTSMLLYIYIGVTILYPCILEATKLGATVGRKVCDLKLIKL